MTQKITMDYKILTIKESNSIASIWIETLSDNLISIIGIELIINYLNIYFKQSNNLAIGCFEKNILIGYVLFGNDKEVLAHLINTKKYLILRSFFLNLLLFNLKNIFYFIDVMFFMLLSKYNPSLIDHNNETTELILIGVLKDKQGKNIGSNLISYALKEYNFFVNYRYIKVKTLTETPENIRFYEKNNFIIYTIVFKRVFLKRKI